MATMLAATNSDLTRFIILVRSDEFSGVWASARSERAPRGLDPFPAVWAARRAAAARSRARVADRAANRDRSASGAPASALPWLSDRRRRGPRTGRPAG